MEPDVSPFSPLWSLHWQVFPFFVFSSSQIGNSQEKPISFALPCHEIWVHLTQGHHLLAKLWASEYWGGTEAHKRSLMIGQWRLTCLGWAIILDEGLLGDYQQFSRTQNYRKRPASCALLMRSRPSYESVLIWDHPSRGKYGLLPWWYLDNWRRCRKAGSFWPFHPIWGGKSCFIWI